ncbi:MAG TPA: phosphotransferase [Thermomicrobiales bacterium]|nr:phosphotransferase [Thermomicrobiales bacterium]
MSRPDITIDQVRTFLTEEIGLSPQSIETLRPGAWSAAFGFRAEDGDFVLRIAKQADDFARDAYAHRFAGPDLPIPTVTHRGGFGDAFYAISERMPGGFLDDLDADGLRLTLPSLTATLDALRTADVSTSSGYGTWDERGNGTYASWPGFLTKTLEDDPDYRGGPWRAKLETSPTGIGAFDRDAAVFRQFVTQMPNMRHVLHCDLINFNAFVKDHRVSGVIDWGCAIYGDFVYELAWFEFWRPWYPQWAGISVAETARKHFATQGVDLIGFDERLLCYQIHIGLTHEIYTTSIGRWEDLATITRLTTQLVDRIR